LSSIFVIGESGLHLNAHTTHSTPNTHNISTALACLRADYVSLITVFTYNFKWFNWKRKGWYDLFIW